MSNNPHPRKEEFVGRYFVVDTGGDTTRVALCIDVTDSGCLQFKGIQQPAIVWTKYPEYTFLTVDNATKSYVKDDVISLLVFL